MNDDERRERAWSFGQIADQYDLRRLGYSGALVSDVLALAPGGRLLEAGAGTKATLLLAQRGASIVAIEPDPAMAAVVARKTRGMAVDVQESTFESSAAAPGAFDLVAAAQLWHGVDPERRAAVAARALKAGTPVCLWWNRPGDLSRAAAEASRRLYGARTRARSPGVARASGQRRAEVPTAFGLHALDLPRLGSSTIGRKLTTPTVTGNSCRPTRIIFGCRRRRETG